MKYTDLTGLSLAELNALLKKTKLSLLGIRYRMSLKQDGQPHEVRNARKLIARIMTAIAAKQKQGE